MLSDMHFNLIEEKISNNATIQEIRPIVNKIQSELNPHPAGQKKNIR